MLKGNAGSTLQYCIVYRSPFERHLDAPRQSIDLKEKTATIKYTYSLKNHMLCFLYIFYSFTKLVPSFSLSLLNGTVSQDFRFRFFSAINPQGPVSCMD
jgi:hypothetical protein